MSNRVAGRAKATVITDEKGRAFATPSYKIANVANALPKSAQPGAKKALHEIYNAADPTTHKGPWPRSPRPTTRSSPRQSRRSPTTWTSCWPSMAFPAEHWIRLRTTNPIESTFATVRLRTKVTRGAGSAAAALAMVFKLVESAQQRWRAVNAPHLVALVRAGVRFERGHLVERSESHAA
ncbi:hypothetical protein FNV65_40930 [Streptomyces sp. S1A1-8]|uniref:transposase n=1 Tax=unclassified Streptomyces TaxID=2593676 RepID=UPI001162C348|nr:MULTISPECIES: transposase [unclassified Streptomyces]QDO01738.1 hypothetical protein FNV58_42345 [Streptomyces sp. RLB1-9]QDO23470.1 hypothetical protein FNV65_40930 [Streptomyces sp. S1A1-8]QDO33596.1 hypothetical protein FNV63_40955 [Streptomyces sp. S1A1-3]